MSGTGAHWLLYEPRTEGHHLGWLRFITEDLLAAGLRLSLAVDLRPDSAPRVHSRLGDLVTRVTLLSAYDVSGRRHGDGKAGSVTYCLQQSGAERVLLCALDEIASYCWRRAAFGLMPPPELHRRLGGIYHRPRFLVAPWWSPNRWLKQAGFARLVRGGWVNPLLFVDEYVARDCAQRYPKAPISFLPDPCPPGMTGDRAEARGRLGLPLNRSIFLFYGTGHRRKGLQVAVDAMLGLEPAVPAFLFCVGQQRPEGATARGLEQLVQAGRARLWDRYVSDEEQRLCFAAADVVLLPYLNHFGSSGVLCLAAAAGKMVIASDEQLLGRLTRDHELGLLFRSGDARALRSALRRATSLSAEEKGRFEAGAARFARAYSREAFRGALCAAVAGRVLQ